MRRTRWAPAGGRRRAAAALSIPMTMTMAMLGAAAPASGSPDSWGPVRSIFEGGRINDINTLVTADGREVVQWHRLDPSGECSVIFTRVRESVDADWQDQGSFAKQGPYPRVALVHAGHRIALVSETCDDRIMLLRMNGTSWAEPLYLDVGKDFALGAASINRRGDVLVAPYDTTSIQPATLAAGSSTWTRLPEIRRENDSFPAHALITDDGDVTLVTEATAIRTTVDTLVDGAWQHELIDLPYGERYAPSAFTSEPGGLLALVFHASGDFGQENGQILAYVRDRGADSFDAPMLLDERPQKSAYVSAATSARGDLVVAWTQPPRKNGRGVPVVARRSPDGTWSTPQTPGGGPLFGTPHVKRTDGGRSLLVIEKRYKPNILFVCDLALACSEIASPDQVDHAFWRGYEVGPRDAVVAFAAGRDRNNYRYENLRSTDYTAALPG